MDYYLLFASIKSLFVLDSLAQKKEEEEEEEADENRREKRGRRREESFLLLLFSSSRDLPCQLSYKFRDSKTAS